MKTKSILAVLLATVFLVSFMGVSFANKDHKGCTAKGTITKIEGNMVTVKDKMGKEKTVEVKDISGLKVGEKIKVKDGVAKKMTGKWKELEKTEKSEKPGKSEY
jgi:transcription antitermination factor NusG